jgi:hypothetical protein
MTSVVNRICSRLRRWRYRREFELLRRLAAYAPNSRGNPAVLSDLALWAAADVPALLAEVAHLSPVVARPAAWLPWDALQAAPNGQAADLGELFVKYGSDKATDHNYHVLYAHLLQDRPAVTRLLEIGLGTNNEDVLSHMTRVGRPGASLRAFRDYLPNAAIFGADVDRRILFREDRIETFHVDQTNPDSFRDLASRVGSGFDLVIDDGLHSPLANLQTLLFALPLLKPGGCFVVEDILPPTGPIWEVAAYLLAREFRCQILQTKRAVVFVAQRLQSSES